MGRFRRRKPAVSWLPVLGTANELTQEIGPLISGSVTVLGTGGITSDIAALTYDFPLEQVLAAAPAQTLSDWEGSSYRLRRIVGKIFVSMDQEAGAQGATRPAGAICTAGFIVLRVNEETGNPLAVTDQYNPLNADNIRDPWIWRRSWILSNGVSASAGQPKYGEYPFSNVEYGSVFDGPHIDQKTARIIGPEERLFFCLGTQGLDLAEQDSHIHYVLDYRLLASMRRTAGNRRNASR